MNILCVIPARYASSRLPGKPLADIAGKPMIQRVYEQACLAELPVGVIVAADHAAVAAAVRAFGGQVMMTDSRHPTGTDRLAEVAAAYPEADGIINVQGDEPLISPAVIDLLAAALAEQQAAVTTLMTAMTAAEYANPAAVKVVTDLQGFALYFSRSLIPFPRQPHPGYTVCKHIGIYAYRRDFLLKFAQLAPTPLEQAESLEQLRALEHGYRIKVLKTDETFIGVDTEEDLAEINRIFAQKQPQARQP